MVKIKEDRYGMSISLELNEKDFGDMVKKLLMKDKLKFSGIGVVKHLGETERFDTIEPGQKNSNKKPKKYIYASIRVTELEAEKVKKGTDLGDALSGKE